MVPVIAAGVSSAMAKRAETEFMIQYAFEVFVRPCLGRQFNLTAAAVQSMARLDAVGVEALALSSKQLDCADLVCIPCSWLLLSCCCCRFWWQMGARRVSWQTRCTCCHKARPDTAQSNLRLCSN